MRVQLSILLVLPLCLSFLPLTARPPLTARQRRIRHRWSRGGMSSSLGSTASDVMRPSGISPRNRLSDSFSSLKSSGRSAMVPYLTCGFPRAEDSVDLLLGLQEGGATMIEVGVPYSDPQADGPTVQRANEIALENGVESIGQCLDVVRKARERGLTVPVILMGYYNSFYQFTVDRLGEEAEGLIDGVIVVDLPMEESKKFVDKLSHFGLSFIPLVTPVTPTSRIQSLAMSSSSFIYCVSVTGVTGARDSLPDDIQEFISRVRSQTEQPLLLGFGVKTPQQVEEVSSMCDGVVVGSAILNSIDASPDKSPEQKRKEIAEFVATLAKGTKQKEGAKNQATVLSKDANPPDAVLEGSNFGMFGGQYIPETLSEAFREISEQYAVIKDDPEFVELVARYRRDFVGGPTSLHFAPRLTEYAGGANIFLKREDLAHTGAHKINNAIGQALLAKRLGKKRIIAETGAGQHGVATATVCAMLGLECIIYMGAVDTERQKLNVFRMNTLGAKVVPVTAGQATLKDAINEAMRDWVTNVRTTHYLIGSAVGPHPFPTIVRDFQSVIGNEIKEQMAALGEKVDAVVACVGGGSNAIGAFYTFIEDPDVELYGAEAAGHGVNVKDGHCATLSVGTPGVLQGAMTYIIQNDAGQSSLSHSISAGLDYVGVGPEHAYLKHTGRATYVAVDDKQALEGFDLLCKYEGIIPALETSHAIYYAVEKLAKSLGKGKNIVINLSGRGDKDMPQIAKIKGVDV